MVLKKFFRRHRARKETISLFFGLIPGIIIGFFPILNRNICYYILSIALLIITYIFGKCFVIKAIDFKESKNFHNNFMMTVILSIFITLGIEFNQWIIKNVFWSLVIWVVYSIISSIVYVTYSKR